MVACGNAGEVELIVEEPSLVVEGTSPGTRATDRREKLEAYMRVPSLRLYLIVEQRRKHVIVYSRDRTGEWLRDEIDGDGAVEIAFLETSFGAPGEGEDWDEDEGLETESD